MIPDDPELRRALDARSAPPAPDFAARLGATFRAGRPHSTVMPAIAAVVVLALCAATIGVLAYTRHVFTPGGAASGPRLSTPRPTESPIPMPTYATVDAVSHDVVWVLVADDHLYRSTDRGIDWERRPMPPQPGRSFSFLDSNEGWFLGLGSPATQCQAEVVPLWHTTDGGATWHQVQTSGIAEAQCKESVTFADSTHGFLTAWDPNHRPTVYRTVDGGLTWKASTLSDPAGFVSQDGGFTLSAGPIRAFGSTLLLEATGTQDNSTNSYQYVFRSTDGGATWSSAHLPWLYVYFVTATRWLWFDGTMHETVDGGRTWHPFVSDYSQAAGIGPDIVFGDASVGYASVRGLIQRTDDGGAHWTVIETPGAVQPG